jgi:predicted Zn finger-like uncharacterized protein
MNIRCPQCQTVFRVDPERVPVGGVRARCARCNAVFALSRSGIGSVQSAASVGATQATAPAAAARPVPAGGGATQATAPPRPAAAPLPRPEPARPQPVMQAPPAPAASAQPPAAAAPSKAAPATGAPKRASFTQQDPNTRAQRLARALVSDIVAYNKERRDQTHAAGTMKTEFREEIRKSWEEYVAQVGLEMAKGTPFFREALNEILAKGDQIF